MSHQNPQKQEHKASTRNERRSFRFGHFAVPVAAALFLATASAVDPTTNSNNKEPSDGRDGACCGGTIANCDCSAGATLQQQQQQQQQRPNYSTGRKNPDCPPDRPIQMTDDNHSCVPCIAYTEHPGEPDCGCTSDEPLCVIDQQQQRANPGQAGHSCAPYPCHNTKPSGILAMDTTATDKTKNMALGMVMDEGCTPSQPICVDALGSDPPPGGPGMKCVEATTIRNGGDDDTTKEGNVAVRKRRSAWGRPAFGVLDKSHSNKNAAASSFDLVSLCTGCPLSGQGRSCESTKACDSLGGIVQSNVPSW